jgi:glycerol-3-phosphate dehydrogenase
MTLKCTDMAKQIKEYDLAKIGSGINRTGIALNLASKGLIVLLCKKTDIASATSSNSLGPVIDEVKYLCF